MLKLSVIDLFELWKKKYADGDVDRWIDDDADEELHLAALVAHRNGIKLTDSQLSELGDLIRDYIEKTK
jgi:hypothetical protein